MKKLMFAAVAAVATVGAANAATSWTFDMSKVTDTTRDSIAIKDGFNATTVGGKSENPVGAGYGVYYIWGVDNDTRKLKGDAILEGLRAGLSMEETIEAKKLTLLASSETDKDGYAKAVTANVDEKMYYKSGKYQYEYLACVIAILGESDVFLYSAGNPASAHQVAVGATSTNYRVDIAGTTKYSEATLSSGWYAVPEPTSGLLLLLGVAGLALKRKRA